MDIRPGLHLRMSQQLVMTPRLQMALKILQVSTMELEQFLKQELLQNPLLERVDDDEEVETETSEESQEVEKSEVDGEAAPAEKDEAADEPVKTEEADAAVEDLDWDDYLDDVYAHAYGQNLEREEDDRLERVPVAVATFEDQLKHQLHVECDEDGLIGIAEYIIDELGRNGYVRDTVEGIASALHAPLSAVQRALKIVQSLDPAGIGARDIRECLLLQLERKGMSDSVAARVITSCFEELKACKYDQIRRKLGVTVDELRSAIAEISKLDPRPRMDPGGVIRVTSLPI